MKIHNPGNTEKLTSLYVIVSRDAKGNEGICGGFDGEGGGLPFITSSKDMLERFKKILAKIPIPPNTTVHVLRFTRAEELESLGGGG